MKVGDNAHGFAVTAVTPLGEIRATAYQLQHVKSGARLLHVSSKDEENLFSISFPTPPPNDTGVPHILEHSVLAGSRKFPVKEPFFEMIKMSMATFINAMTGPDCTYYPVASNVEKDLFNLAEVYFDAVFHPLLTEQTFQREGHHLAPADPDKPNSALSINGIVFNEMKGDFSTPDSRLYRSMQRGLFPDSIYGLESGGDPESIPDLTYADFLAFHKTHYHPSNAYFFIYGNIPTAKYLEFLAVKLDEFSKIEVGAPVVRQPRWNSPRRICDTYPVGDNEGLAEKTYVAISWLVGSGTDPVDVILLRLLDLILFGNEGAPLRKAIIDSKLGADLTHSGDGAVGIENTFSVGLKGTEADREQAFVKLVMDTLQRVSAEGIEPHRIEAAFHQATYSYLEIDQMFPLRLMQSAIQPWIHGGDPLTFLTMGSHLEKCRALHKSEPGLFSRLITERLLNNPHRMTVVLTPDQQMQTRTDVAFERRMSRVRAGLSTENVRKIASDAMELDRLNGIPNSAEAIATLPQLKVSELPRDLAHVSTSVEELVGGTELLCNDVFANGVCYLQFNFDLRGLPADLWPYLPRYVDAVEKLGAAGMNYEQIAARIASATGGISCWPRLSTHSSNSGRPLYGLCLSLRALDGRIAPALELLHDILFGVDPRDKSRLLDVLRQAQAYYRTSMVNNGSAIAGLHAGRGMTEEQHLAELVWGLPQLPFTEKLTGSYDSNGDELVSRIEAVRDFLLCRNRVTASFTGSSKAYDAVHAALSSWVGSMRDGPVTDSLAGFTPFTHAPREGLAGPMQVAHCVKVMPAPHFSHPDETLLALGCHMVSMDYMMSEIRFKGNAYGAHFVHSGFSSVLHMGSYRDPHIARTLDVFDRVSDYISKADWTQQSIDHAIIATAKQDMRPIRPMRATGLALERHLAGITDEQRKRRYDRLRSATPAAVKRALLDVLSANEKSGAVCVVSSREKLELANREMRGRPLAIEDILKQ